MKQNRLIQFYYHLKLRKKALVLYLIFGTCLTIPIAAISSVFLMRYLLSEEQKTLDQTLSQSVSQMESDLSLYTALSDYCFNNTELSSIINETYTDNYFDMYKALEDTIIPTFRTYQLLHPNLKSIKLYTDCGLPAYKKYVYPFESMENEPWFDQIKNSYQPIWFITDDHHLLSVRKLIDNLTYKKTNYLCIEANFASFFSPLSSILSDGTGVLVWSSATNTAPSFSEDNCGLSTVPQTLNDLKTDYLYASHKLSCGWTVSYYRSIYSCHEMNFPAIAVLWVLASLLMTLLFCCTYMICGTLIEPIEKLSRKVQSITASGSHAPIKTRRTDEIGDLTQHFNQMVQQVYQNKLQINEYRLKALYAQINPHFLYNTMDMINWLAQQGRTAEVSSAVQSLSRFYKLTLSRKQSISTIAQETEHATIYLEIQNMRYHNSIEFVSDIPDELMEYQIPKLTLQPLIENAVLHGILEKDDKAGTIVLTGWLEDSSIVLLISDDGVGISPDKLSSILSGEGSSSSGGTNIAVYNTHRRLQILYGTDYGLTYSNNPGGGTEVEIHIPAIRNTTC